jgi:hypothetical protein
MKIPGISTTPPNRPRVFEVLCPQISFLPRYPSGYFPAPPFGVRDAGAAFGKAGQWGFALKPCGLAENSRWQANAPPPEMSSNRVPPRMAVAENRNRRVDRSLAPRSGCWGRCVSRFRWWRGLTTGYFLTPHSGCGGRCVSQFRWWRGLTTGYFLAPSFGVRWAGAAFEKA